MPVLPRRLILLGAGLATRRTARHLAHRGRDSAEQLRTFRQLVTLLAPTAYGRAAGIESGMPYATFRSRVPLVDHDGLAPYLDRAKRGEADLLCPGICSNYALTAGTTTGFSRHVPLPPEMVRHFHRGWKQALLFYTARTRRLEVLHGRHLLLGGANPPCPLPDSKPFVATAGDACAAAALSLPRWANEHFYEPGSAIDQMNDWNLKLDAIVERTWNRDISLVAGLPKWALLLAEQLRMRVDAGSRFLSHLQTLWPKLECFVHGGTPVGPFAGALREALGPNVHFHEVYAAAEGMIAAQDAEGHLGLRLLSDAGIFFEFVPAAEFNDARPALSGAKALSLDEVKPGIDYALVLTTPGGLARFAVGDVVRFLSTEPPRLVWVGRTRMNLNSVGEHVSEKEITDALVGVCDRHVWRIVNFHVAPLLAASPTTGQKRTRHEWWVELKAGTNETPTGPILALDLDRELQRVNPNYAAKRQGGLLEVPVVRLVIPGVFEQWMRSSGQWGGVHKVPRCSDNRRIANALSTMTRFTTDTQVPWRI